MNWELYAYIILFALAQTWALQSHLNVNDDRILKNVLGELNRLTKVIENQESKNKEQDIRMHAQEMKNAEQGALIEVHGSTINMLQKALKQQEMKNEDYEIKIRKLEVINEELEIKIRHQDSIIDEHASIIHYRPDGADSTYGNNSKLPDDNLSFTPGLHVVTGFACDLDTMTLACTDGKTILVESAYYGQYIQTCSDTCCPPHPQDCTESMEQNAPVDWMALKTLCDNTTSCEFQNPGRDVPSCAVPYNSNYALVYYACLPDADNEPSGFTATNGASRSFAADDVIIFELVLTNVGNNYLAETSTYVCPRNGIYLFSLTVMNVETDYMYVEVMREDMPLIVAYSDGVTEHQGAVTVVTECTRGERVWVRCAYDNNCEMYDDGSHNYNVFSGYLLYPY